MSSTLTKLSHRLQDRGINWRKSTELRAHIEAELAPIKAVDRMVAAIAAATCAVAVDQLHPATLELAKTMASEQIHTWIKTQAAHNVAGLIAVGDGKHALRPEGFKVPGTDAVRVFGDAEIADPVPKALVDTLH